jgi:ribosomal protein S18 acetylase RimI-like enzyme
MRPEIRPATSDDKTAVLHLWNLTRSAAATAEDEPAMVERLLAYDPGALLVATVDGAIVGAVIAAWDGWRGHLYRLAVSPGQRRQGIGQRLVEAGQERLRSLGATRVNAAVAEDESGSAAFWHALGYGRDAEISRFAKAL